MEELLSLTDVGHPVSHQVLVMVDSGKGDLLLLGAGRDHEEPLDKDRRSGTCPLLDRAMTCPLGQLHFTEISRYATGQGCCSPDAL